MREILFRGKQRTMLDWVEGTGVFNDGTNTWLSANESNKPIACGLNHKNVLPETVGQFTGLTDKNGKKIFEGDIVAQNWYDHDEPSDDSFGEVVFCEYDCSFSVMDVQKDGIVPLGRCHAYHWEAEVIGNIHDNPELLEVTADG